MKITEERNDEVYKMENLQDNKNAEKLHSGIGFIHSNFFFRMQYFEFVVLRKQITSNNCVLSAIFYLTYYLTYLAYLFCTLHSTI